MRTSDFDYQLPEELIAQSPPENRGDSRMLILDAKTGDCKVGMFSDIVEYFRPGDTLVRNDTRVIRARMFARKDTGARIEIMLLRPGADPGVWECYMKPGKRAPAGTVLELLKEEQPSGHRISVISKTEEGVFTIRFDGPAAEIIAECGVIPLPPYIKRSALPPDAERYQTVYAVNPGAVAAPTAGLHFTDDILSRIFERGVNAANLTLHVGAGTFKPVSVENIPDHKMHSEDFIFSESTAELLNNTVKNNGRIFSVGTTSLRVLESCVTKDRKFIPQAGSTDIFIYPPYQVLSADCLLTNFHLPQSTLLMLVCAFAGYENIMKAYRLAVEEKMRFFSYGDCMLILR